MNRTEVDLILKRQRELIARSRGAVERSLYVRGRSDEVIRNTSSLVAYGRTLHASHAR